MVDVIIVDLQIKEWIGQQKLFEMIPVFFLTLIVQLCTNRTKDVLHTNCIALCMKPNMGHGIQQHGYMKNKRLEIELDIIKYMYGHMTLTLRY